MELAVARAKALEDMAPIAAQKLRIAKLERQVQRAAVGALGAADRPVGARLRGVGSRRHGRRTAELAAARTTTVHAFTRRRTERDAFSDHLPRERVVIDPPTACACCGASIAQARRGRDADAGDDARRWFSCRDCEKISQAPAPFHVIPRASAGPSLLAMIVFEKFGQHQPPNRQAERYALEGAPIALSTMADAAGAVCAALDPLRRLVEAHVMAAERLHGDDTTVPVLGERQHRHRTALDLRPRRPTVRRRRAARHGLPYSRDRRGEHPQAHLAGRLRGPQQPISPRPEARSNPGSGVLGACAPTVLRHGRYRGECARQGRRKKSSRCRRSPSR